MSHVCFKRLRQRRVLQLVLADLVQVLLRARVGRRRAQLLHRPLARRRARLRARQPLLVRDAPTKQRPFFGSIDAYLHYHHRNVRECSMLVAAKVRKDLNFSADMQDQSRRAIAGAMNVLDQQYLASSDYLFGDQPTLADLAACAEIAQLSPQYTNLYDFSPYANLSAWLQKMAQVPGYDTVHIPLATLGDISEEAPSIEVLKAANMQGFKALQGNT